MKRSVSVLLWVLVCFAIGAVASYLQSDALVEWYPYLNNSSLTPPAWVFPVAWSVLYLLMGISVGLLWGVRSIYSTILYLLFGMQLVLNFLWSVFFFYPADFTFVCPTELEDLANKYEQFRNVGCEVYAVSTDTHFVHKAWHDASERIRKINYPMLADPTHALSRDFQVLIESDGLAERGTFIINPEGKIVGYEVTAGNVGRNAEELLRKVEEYEPRTPRFMGGQSSAAERGTATHLFMQFCDFERLNGSEESVRKESDRLLASGFIPRDAAEIIRYREVAAFSRSALFKEIKSAKRIYREQRFNIFLDAKNFTSSPELAVEIDGEKLLVQGVIDLFFIDEDEKLVLCDYKTDRLTPEELKDAALAQKTLSERHGEQLGYYAMALERIMGRRPDRVCIFSLHAGREFDVI